MKPIVFASLIGAAASIVALSLRYAPAAPLDPFDDAEHLLCDKEVDDLLHSKDLVEVTRAGILVNAIPCAIGRRLQMSVK